MIKWMIVINRLFIGIITLNTLLLFFASFNVLYFLVQRGNSSLSEINNWKNTHTHI